MSWDQSILDLWSGIYWNPEQIGLDPIKLDFDSSEISPSLIRNSSLRGRTKKWGEVHDKLRKDEVFLTTFFNITFSILPDTLIQRWLAEPLNIHDEVIFKSFGLLELSDRFGWGQKNITQHDGVFISKASIICVELKLNASTNINQLLKYAFVIMNEESISGIRSNIGLLYIVPDHKINSIWSNLDLKNHSVDHIVLDRKTKLNMEIQELYTTHRADIANILDRMHLNIISWSQLYTWMSQELNSLSPERSEHQVLHRLLSGFLNQLRAHKGTGISVPEKP